MTQIADLIHAYEVQMVDKLPEQPRSGVIYFDYEQDRRMLYMGGQWLEIAQHLSGMNTGDAAVSRLMRTNCINCAAPLRSARCSYCNTTNL